MSLEDAPDVPPRTASAGVGSRGSKRTPSPGQDATSATTATKAALSLSQPMLAQNGHGEGHAHGRTGVGLGLGLGARVSPVHVGPNDEEHAAAAAAAATTGAETETEKEGGSPRSVRAGSEDTFIPPMPEHPEPVRPFDLEAVAPPRKASWTTAGWLMVADVVGAGVLALAVAFAQLGWVLGLASSLLSYALNMYLGLLLLEAHERWPSALSYMDMASQAFGPRARVFVGLSVYILLLFLLGDYLLIAGATLQIVFYDAKLCLVVWVFLSTLILAPLLQFRLLANVKRLLIVNVVTLVVSLLVALITLSQMGTTAAQAYNKSGPPELVASTLTFGSFAKAQALISFAYSGVFIYLEIISEMQDDKEFRKSLLYLSGPFTLVSYVTVACWGYYFVGSNAQGMIITNIPPGPAYRAAATFLFVHIIITFLIKGIVLTRVVQRFTVTSSLNDFSFGGNVTYFFISTGLLGFTFVLANLVPFFDDLTSLLGSFFMPVVGFVLPIMFVLRARKLNNVETPTWERILMGVICFVMVVLCIVGTVASMDAILKRWVTYGKPFECSASEKAKGASG